MYKAFRPSWRLLALWRSSLLVSSTLHLLNEFRDIWSKVASAVPPRSRNSIGIALEAFISRKSSGGEFTQLLLTRCFSYWFATVVIRRNAIKAII